MKENKLAFFVLFIVAIIWGGGYIASESALQNNWDVFSILFQRNLIGFIVLFVFCAKTKFWKNKKTMIVGIVAGVLYFLGFTFQLAGQKLTTVSNTGLLSSLGVILVPIFYWIMFKKRPPFYSFVGCFIGLAGAFILSYQEGMKFHIGDLIVIAGAFAYAIHLTYVGKEGDDLDLFSLVCVQCLTMAVLSFVGILITGSKLIGEPKGWYGVLYYSLISGVLGVTGQFWCQRIIDSYKVSLVLTLEGLFAAIFSIILLGEELKPQTIIGGSIMLFAAFFIQIIDMIKAKKIKGETI